MWQNSPVATFRHPIHVPLCLDTVYCEIWLKIKLWVTAESYVPALFKPWQLPPLEVPRMLDNDETVSCTVMSQGRVSVEDIVPTALDITRQSNLCDYFIVS